MTIASYLTRGIGPDGTPAFIVSRGLSPAPTTANIITRGFNGTPSGYLLRGFTPANATQSAVVCTTTSWTGYSLQENQVPAVAVGDTFFADLVTTPGGYAVTVNGDGTVTIDSGGDTTRQRFQADIFDVSLAANYGAFTVYVNNHPPILNVQPDNVRVLTNNAMAAINFTPTDPAAVDYIIDQDGDPITSAQISGGLPIGVTLAGNVLSGTPTSVVSNNVTFRFTDTVGEYVDCTLNYISDVGATVPNVVGRTQAEAVSDLAAVGLTVDPTSTASFSLTVPAGNVISQGVTAGSRVFSNSPILINVSLGAANAVTVPNVAGLTVAAATAALTTAGLGLGAITYQYTDSVLSGHVVSQGTAAGTVVAYASTVAVVVARPTFLLTSYFSGAGILSGIGVAR